MERRPLRGGPRYGIRPRTRTRPSHPRPNPRDERGDADEDRIRTAVLEAPAGDAHLLQGTPPLGHQRTATVIQTDTGGSCPEPDTQLVLVQGPRGTGVCCFIAAIVGDDRESRESQHIGEDLGGMLVSARDAPPAAETVEPQADLSLRQRNRLHSGVELRGFVQLEECHVIHRCELTVPIIVLMEDDPSDGMRLLRPLLFPQLAISQHHPQSLGRHGLPAPTPQHIHAMACCQHP